MEKLRAEIGDLSGTGSHKGEDGILHCGLMVPERLGQSLATPIASGV